MIGGGLVTLEKSPRDFVPLREEIMSDTSETKSWLNRTVLGVGLTSFFRLEPRSRYGDFARFSRGNWRRARMARCD